MNITRILISHPESDSYCFVHDDTEVDIILQDEPLCHELGDVTIELTTREVVKAMVEFNKLKLTNKNDLIEALKADIKEKPTINDLNDLGLYIKDMGLDDNAKNILKEAYINRLSELKTKQEIYTTGTLDGKSI